MLLLLLLLLLLLWLLPLLLIGVRGCIGVFTVLVMGLKSSWNGFISSILFNCSFSEAVCSASSPISSVKISNPISASRLTCLSLSTVQPSGYFAFSSSISILTLAEPTSNSAGSVTSGQGGP
ncbi:hypothetical protein ES703_18264 [subsurface metagenome]